MANRVLIINKGKILTDKTLQELQSNQQQILEVEFDMRIEREFLDQLPNITAV